MASSTWLLRSSPPNTPWTISSCLQNLRSNISLEYYDAGHMMYLRDDSLAKLKDNIATFLDKTAK